MSVGKFVDLTRYAMLPPMLIVVGATTLMLRDTAFARAFPYYHYFAILFVMITIERVYSYKHAVSQRHMIWRDLMSTAVQTLVLGALLGAVVLPALHYFPNTFLGRRFLFGLSNQLGPCGRRSWRFSFWRASGNTGCTAFSTTTGFCGNFTVITTA